MHSVEVASAEARTRASTYAFLAGVFTSHPTLHRVRGLVTMAYELGLPCSNDFSLSELDQEYMDLFVFPGGRYVAPYESVFRDRWPLPADLAPGANRPEGGGTVKGPMMGESTLAVDQFYRMAGIAPMEDLPDHIGNELRFMAYLWIRETKASAGEAHKLAELRSRFRNEHLLEWTGKLRDRVSENDRLGFYLAACELVGAVLQNEA